MGVVAHWKKVHGNVRATKDNLIGGDLNEIRDHQKYRGISYKDYLIVYSKLVLSMHKRDSEDLLTLKMFLFFN